MGLFNRDMLNRIRARAMQMRQEAMAAGGRPQGLSPDQQALQARVAANPSGVDAILNRMRAVGAGTTPPPPGGGMGSLDSAPWASQPGVPPQVAPGYPNPDGPPRTGMFPTSPPPGPQPGNAPAGPEIKPGWSYGGEMMPMQVPPSGPVDNGAPWLNLGRQTNFGNLSPGNAPNVGLTGGGNPMAPRRPLPYNNRFGTPLAGLFGRRRG